MKIVLIIPDRPYLLKQKALPHLGVLYISDALKKLGHEIEILDFADGWKFVEADIYGISTVTPDFLRAIEILKWLKEKGAKKVTIGGAHASICPQECIDAGFDGISIGDGELTMEKLIKGEIIAEAWSKEIDDFYPDRSKINLWDYEFYIGDTRTTPMMTARGCIWGKCAFCCCYYKCVRFHSAEHVKKEIKQIAELGFKGIMIYDDEFFSYPKRDLEIIKSLKEHNIAWRCFSRSDLTLRNKELIKTASESGLKELLIGIESADDRILKTIEKGATVKMNKETIRFLYSINVNVKCAMMVGLPGEDKLSLKNMWKFCEEMEPYVHDFDFSIYTPLPGSKIWSNPEKYDLIFKKEYKPFKTKPTEYNCNVRTKNLSSEELLKERKKLEDRFKKLF